MGIIRFAIENPVKIAVGVILVMLFGLLSFFAIPVQLTPNVDKPIITVTTRWNGASPQEIESEIIDRQEDKLKSVTNLKKMTSTSSQNEGVITLEFPVGVNKDVAYRDVSDKLRQVSDYPEEVDEPVMSATDDDMANTIAWLILYADSPDVNVAALKTFVEDKVKPELERAEGVAEVDVYGGLEREIQVVIDPYLLAARQLTFRDVEAALRRQNTNISAGTVRRGKRDFTYRTLGEYTNLEEIEETVIAYQAGGPVKISDVGKVVDGLKKPISFVRSMGRNVIALPARRETGSNVMTAMASLKERIVKVNREYLNPRGLGLELTQVYDETTYIKGAIDIVVQNIFIGGLLAIAVLWLFLRSTSATGIIAVAIPVCAVGTFLVITMMGRTLNVVMLAGMAFAVGMVVDNAIVVLENIYRHRTMGKNRLDAALDGAKEVWGAILASTLTTMAVFLPVITIEEEAGQLFKDIAIAIAAAVGLSLLVSVVVIPPLASRFFSAKAAEREGSRKNWRFAEWMGALVAQINRSTVGRLAVVVGISGAAIIGSTMLAPAAEYLPAGNKNLVFGFLFTPPGYSIETFRDLALVVEEGDPNDPYDGIRPFWEAGNAESPEEAKRLTAQLPEVTMQLGGRGSDLERVVKPPAINNFFFVSFGGGAFMGCTSAESTNVKPLENVMNRSGGRVPGVFTFFNQTSLFQTGRSSGGGAVDIEIRSDDQEAVVTAAQAIEGKLRENGYNQIQPNPQNYKLGRPEIQIVPERSKSADLGLNVTDVGFMLETFVDGAFVGEFNDRGDKIDLVIKVEGNEEAPKEKIAQTPIYTPAGKIVPISSAVTLTRTTAPQQINHIEEMNSVTLSPKPKLGVPLQETMREIEEDVIAPLRASGAVPESVITMLAGTADKLTQTKNSLIGDFEGAFSRGGLFGMSMGKTMLALIVLLALVITAVRLFIGARPSVITGGIGLLVIFAILLALNPNLFYTVFQSRAILALLITYLLMAALFESFAYPFVIMLSVPLAAVGGFAALRIVHQVSLYDVTAPIQQLDVLTMLGFIILIGIVVNNAILLVHQALVNIREYGQKPSEAVANSVTTRTRPIFMSAMTSIFGMFPLVIMGGEGSELYRGLGSVVLGGLLVSTIFTLIVVPAMFSLFMDAQAWVLGISRREAVVGTAGAAPPAAAHSPDM